MMSAIRLRPPKRRGSWPGGADDEHGPLDVADLAQRRRARAGRRRARPGRAAGPRRRARAAPTPSRAARSRRTGSSRSRRRRSGRRARSRRGRRRARARRATGRPELRATAGGDKPQRVVKPLRRAYDPALPVLMGFQGVGDRGTRRRRPAGQRKSEGWGQDASNTQPFAGAGLRGRPVGCGHTGRGGPTVTARTAGGHEDRSSPASTARSSWPSWRTRAIDLEHSGVRVPNGIEVDAHRDRRRRSWTLVARGRRDPRAGPGVQVERRADRASSRRSAAATRCCRGRPTPTVRVVRADYFTTKGQGFLYVEARTTQGEQTDPIVGMTLENDTGPGHGVHLGAHDEPLRRLRRLHVPPQPVQGRARGRPDPRHLEHRRRQAIGKVSDWLRDVTPLTATPATSRTSSTSTSTRSSSTRASRRSPQQYPDIAEIVALPNKTNGYQRKAQAHRSAGHRPVRRRRQLRRLGP